MAMQVVVLVVLISGIIKFLNAWLYYGFFSGDDVEIHEMTFARLFAWDDWSAWNVRNAFYPMVFIYPLQALAFHFGFNDEAALVLVGRITVVFFSTLSLILVYDIAKEYFRSIPTGLCALFLLASSHIHTTFASSVLPRSVASVFVLLSLWVLVRFGGNRMAPLIGGIFLGIGASIRFSEAIFVPCVILYLFYERRYAQALWAGLTSLGAAALILGVSDVLYWGEAFFSFKNIVTFTLVEGKSSRGYQPFYFYLINAGSWSNYLMIGLIAYSVKLRQWKMLIWALLPIFMLSFLPHKEPRYLVAVIPFLSMAAGFALWRVFEDLHATQAVNKRRLIIATVVTVLISYSSLVELDGFRFRRYESAVDIARFVRDRAEVSGIAIQQIWRAGGQIYLWRIPNVLNIPFDRLNERAYVWRFLTKPEIQYVAMAAKDVERHDYAGLLEENGFREVAVSPHREYQLYRLFERRSKIVANLRFGYP
jgi:4-amino-4-deoxy-L-arabinose transferase-like glycosyltransferase